MGILDKFEDITLVDENGIVEYCHIEEMDFFELQRGMLIGTKVTQWYKNRDDMSSTLIQAVTTGKESLDYVDILETLSGRVIRQKSNTLCIKAKDKVIGAIEFADYDTEKDVLKKGLGNKSAEKKKAYHISIDDFVGESAEIMEIKHKLEKIANLETPIFITGADGTGKELLARLIHNNSNRAKGAFVYANCGAIPQTLLESILFGTEKGSFTDAQNKEGLFQLADGGTLFLDELNSMSLSAQSALLKAIEEKRIRKIGGSETRAVNVRIIASCNKSVRDVINGNEIRNDLFFRLSSIQLNLPPLKARGKDILLITDRIIQILNSRYGKNIKGISDETKRLFLAYSWPGNVRELRNIIESSFHIASGDYISADVFLERIGVGKTDYIQDIWEEFEKSGQNISDFVRTKKEKMFTEVINECRGDVKRASKLLNMTEDGVKKKIRKQG